MAFIIQTRDSPKAPWKSSRHALRYPVRTHAIQDAINMDEMDECGPIRVYDTDQNAVIWLNGKLAAL